MKTKKLHAFLHEKQQIENVLYKLITKKQLSNSELIFIRDEYIDNIDSHLNIQDFIDNKEDFILKREIETSDEYITDNNGIRFNKHIRFLDFPTHKHNFIEMSYVVSGSVTQIIDDKEMILPEGSFIILSSNVSHSILKTGENDVMVNLLLGREILTSRFLNLLEDSESIYKFFLSFLYNKNDLDQFFIFHTKEYEDIQELIDIMMKEYFGQAKPDNVVLTCYLAALIKKLLSIDRSDIQTYGMYTKQVIDPLLVLNYLKDNLDSVTLKSIAKEMGYNADYFSRVFKDIFGRRFIDILKELRLNEAVKLLKNTDIQIKEIGNMIGYQNTSFFYNAFKEKYSMTPLEYRKSLN